MELFKQPNIDWLGRKWYFLSFSLLFSVAGILSLLFWHHLPLGVDFKRRHPRHRRLHLHAQ